MERKTELEEVRLSLEKVLKAITETQTELEAAKNWGILDILGGDFLISMLKRRRIQKVNEGIELVGEKLKRAQKELADVNLTLVTGIADSRNDRLWDIWADNIITDFRVQGELKQTEQNLKKLEQDVRQLLAQVNQELSEI